MLVLGSADLTTLQERVIVAYNLYASSANSFDYIIVSGGCGAHGSKICEATEMFSSLIKLGVPVEKIKKEEKSNSTIQNYVYSRALKNEQGERIIQPNDSLYVVSNHWHAISVAARFNTHDRVHAVYHIAGKITPSNKDMVDYVGILHKNTDNEDFIKKSLWPSVDASFSIPSSIKNNTIYKTIYFRGNNAFITTHNEDTVIQPISTLYPFLPINWHENIDGAFYHSIEKKVYLFKDDEYIAFNPRESVKQYLTPQKIKDFAKNMPDSWQGTSIDGAYFNPKTQNIHLFKGDETIQVNTKKKKLFASTPQKISNTITPWPFTWGSGDIDACSYNFEKHTISFFRGRDWIEVSLDGQILNGFPKRIKAVQP